MVLLYLSFAEKLVIIESALFFTRRLKYGGTDSHKTKLKNREYREK